MKFVTSTVEEILSERRGLQRVRTQVGRAYVLTQLTGEVAVGDEVVLNTTAVELGLGTGGWHFVHWNLSRRELDAPGPGHIMKLRYTSLQIDTGSTEESDEYEEPADLDGLPVVACSLHSQVAAVAVAFAEKATGARLAYVMTDGAALPLALSDLVATMQERGLLSFTVTAGHAFGGSYEAVSVPSALLVAKWAGADAVVCGMGPGVVGTGTHFGHTATEVATICQAADALGGTSIVAVRYSEADERPRHRGVSHHNEAAKRLASQAWLAPEPAASDPDVGALLSRHSLRVTTMGRSYDDDPAFFRWAAAAGVAAAAKINR